MSLLYTPSHGTVEGRTCQQVLGAGKHPMGQQGTGEGPASECGGLQTTLLPVTGHHSSLTTTEQEVLSRR